MSPWAYFRIFIPSWRFFETPGDVALLKYRTKLTSGMTDDLPGRSSIDWSNWQECLVKPRKTLISFFINPAGNFYLAAQTQVEQTLADLNDDLFRQNFAKSSSYQILHRIVLAKIHHDHNPSPLIYQFKILVQTADDIDGRFEDAVISQEHTS